ncbi:MAG TPA: prolyl oligopeptidase family serine peptidase [Gemmatimonadaceae bacterium]|nr:prolyl oligopeptidase family serine peptidase [Gemmatimonadaceae bacterium]
MRSPRTLVLVALAATLTVPASLAAQAVAQKRALTSADWDTWRSIQGATISPDGKWALYSLVPQVGDGEMVVRATQGTTEYRVPRGFLGRPQMVAGGRPDTASATPPAQFSADGRFALALTYAPMAEFEKARREKKRPADQPKASLAIVNLADGKVTTVQRVRSFRAPRHTGTWVAWLLEPADSATANRQARDSARAGEPERVAATPGGRPRPVADSTPRDRRKVYGSTLVLRNLATGEERRVADVLTYAFDDSAKWLGYTVSSRDVARDGAYVMNPADGREIALLAGRGNYKQFTFDRAAQQVAFVSDKDQYGRDDARYTLYHASLRTAGTAAAIATSSSIGGGMIVSDDGRVTFTRNGNAVLFGVAPPPLDSIPADSLYDKAVFDLWHYRDARLQPQQRVEAARDRNRSFQAIYHLASRKIVRLANDSMPSVSVSDDGRVATAATGERYSIERMWGDDGDDVYLIDATTGSRKLLREKISGNAMLSSGGRYVLFYDRGHWYAHGVASGRTIDVSAPAKGVSFEQETWDTPSIPAPWGVAGWTKDDRSVLVYDRFDVWELDPTGAQAPRMITDSVGRREQIVFRLVDLDRDDPAIDPREPLLFRAFNRETKASGFYRDQLGASRPPERIVMADASFGVPQKARHADQYLLTRGTFIEFPNLHTGRSLTSLQKISDANPQQKNFRWGTVELVSWVSTDGVPLKGLLYKPEDFDPSKKYPMIAYFYEQLSDGMHNYIPPAGRNVINPTHYVSNGYLIFEPDIHYEVGYPGPSAMKSIVPGVQMLIARGFVDPKGLGLQGQSWGGYQTSYMITQTQMFRAAMAGAPVANMTSAYGGIRWGSGLARSFQYEKTQSRIGGSIWQYPMRYFENSPLFWLDKVTTPLLIMHNDADDAVPWYQGIELFVGLRRLGKEVYLLDYNNDVHNPTKRANQKDVAMRMQQFFDHHLRGYPAPDWMVRGIPYQMKGRDQVRMAGEPMQAGQGGSTTTTP